MNKRDFSIVGNEGTDNQELAKGIAFVKSRRAELNVVQMVESMREQAIPNGVIINDGPEAAFLRSAPLHPGFRRGCPADPGSVPSYRILLR